MHGFAHARGAGYYHVRGFAHFVGGLGRLVRDLRNWIGIDVDGVGVVAISSDGEFWMVIDKELIGYRDML